jgi:hypothetical protein
MKNNPFLKFIALFSTSALLFVSCNKDLSNVTTTADSNDQNAEDHQTIVDETEDIFAYNNTLVGGFGNMRVSATDSMGKDLKLDKCATTTSTTANGIITTVIDFGAVHTCEGKTVGGKMTVMIPVKPTAATGLFSQSVVYKDFQRGLRKINGKHTMTIVLENGKAVTKESFTETTITLENGKAITFNSTKSRKIDMKSTLSTEDDEVTVTGTTTAIGSDGKSFKSTIVTALVVKNACLKTSGMFPVAGTIEIERSDKPKATIDYGNGTCDRVYTVNGVEKTRK